LLKSQDTDNPQQYVFMSHDVDWRRQGAPVDHILKRKDRFEEGLLENMLEKNPYYNIPEYMDLEEKFGIRSTFFFRTIYEDGNYEDYEDDIRALIKGGWEVGLHSAPSSINDIHKIHDEKLKLESMAKTIVQANRVHYLVFNKDLPQKLESLGFRYDSSVRHSKDRINESEMGYFMLGNLVEFPITLMDAYMFTFMKLRENQVVPAFKRTLNYGRNLKRNFNIITVIWHDNVLQMIGGRMYKKVLEYLTSQNDITISSGINIARIIKNKI